MTRNSMGQFIAALRRAAGMTQQEVADRLGVSNKAVSRWERDECAPDLSLLPPLAELFGVSCDELLRGERGVARESEGVRAARTERQLRSLVNRRLSAFRILSWISLALSAVGLVCALGISYAFFRPIVGFAVELIFLIAAVLLAALGLNWAREARRDNELFELADEALRARFDNTLGRLSWTAFFAAFAALLLGLPVLLTVGSAGIYSVPAFGFYLIFAAAALLLLVALWLWGRPRYMARLTGQPRPPKPSVPPLRRRMNAWQLGLTLAAALIFVWSPYLDRNCDGTSPAYNVAVCVGLACLLGSLLLFLVLLLRHREERRALLLPGLRNLLYALPALYVTNMHSMSWGSSGRFDQWYPVYLWLSLALAALLTLLFGLIEYVLRRKKVI